jgi:hypothetical protein
VISLGLQTDDTLRAAIVIIDDVQARSTDLV